DRPLLDLGTGQSVNLAGVAVAVDRTGLRGLDHHDALPRRDRPSGQCRGRDGLAHTGVGAGDDEDAHRYDSATLTTMSVARFQSSSLRPALAVTRSREIPSG